ncbi:MAG: hypothetical protein WBX38_15255 [Candidatus Sulfotelmatobacter sp.]
MRQQSAGLVPIFVAGWSHRLRQAHIVKGRSLGAGNGEPSQTAPAASE